MKISALDGRRCFALAGLVLCGLLGAGCEEPLGFLGVKKIDREAEREPAERAEGSWESRLSRSLQEWATRFPREAGRFASGELARMNAAERVYVDAVERFEHLSPDTVPLSSVFVKLYRSYTSYDVYGIFGSKSGNSNINVSVRFDYDLFATSPRSTGDANSRAVAQADMDFQPLRRESLMMEYKYVIGTAFDFEYSSAMPGRPDYFVTVEVDSSTARRE